MPDYVIFWEYVLIAALGAGITLYWLNKWLPPEKVEKIFYRK